MSQVHPSRLGLVPASSSSSSSFRPPPQSIAAGAPAALPPRPIASGSSDMYDSAKREEELRVRLKERNGGEVARDRDRDVGPSGSGSGRDRRREDDDRRSDRRDRDGHDGRDRSRGHRDDSRDRRERSRGRDRQDPSSSTGRRASPTYQPYDRDRARPRSPLPEFVPLGNDGRHEQPPHMRSSGGGDRGYGGAISGNGGYPGGGREGYGGGDRGGRDGYGGGDRGGGGGGAFGRQIMGKELEVRRKARDDSNLVVWPASPTREHDEFDDPEGKSTKKSKSKSKSSRKDKHKSSKSKHKSSSSKRRKYDSDTDSDTDSDDDSDDSHDRRKKSKRSKKDKTNERERSEPAAASKQDEEDDWVVPGDTGPSTASSSALVPIVSSKQADVDMDEDEDDEDVGPQLPVGTAVAATTYDAKSFAHMRPGEGDALAAFVAAGQRIPRRGEIGLVPEQIEHFENVGYVSRHKRMTAVRLRKENQVITAEEKRGILKLQKEEKDKREAIIRESFKNLIDDKLAGQNSGR